MFNSMTILQQRMAHKPGYVSGLEERGECVIHLGGLKALVVWRMTAPRR
jgi:hypothetical protein